MNRNTPVLVRRHRPRSGLTLVEMLVVTAVVVALLSVILPAVQSARESARRTTCLANERQVVTALVNHEAKKGFIPGWRNKVICDSGTTIYPAWPVVVLPYLDRADLYATITSSTAATGIVCGSGTMSSPVWTSGNARLITAVAAGGTTARTQVFLSVFDCPANPVADRSQPTTLDKWATTTGINVSMAYAGNGGTGNNQFWRDGVMADTDPSAPVSGRVTFGQIAVNKGLAGVMILGEKVGRGNPVRAPWVEELGQVSTGTFSWNGQTLTTGSGGACIFGLSSQYSPSNGAVVNPATPSNWQIASCHPAGVVAGYCDGRTDFVDDSIDPKVYGQLIVSSTDATKLSTTGSNFVVNGCK